ncbi:hypothetical protein [Vibrio anguillarum]|uniref:hypothetical protein n=1 Tax=Vibrio anguillarum TaxID=55601 RepID=UPI0016AA87C1|nr:hypothetical protein [Vibrio anguillarum]NOI06980.1 plasmid replication protein RepB [Vibrio anguillarum]
MQIRDFILLFPTGDLVKAEVVPAPMDSGFNLLFYRKSSSNPVPVFAQRGGVRRFSTIDAAVSNAHRVGFSNVTVSF